MTDVFNVCDLTFKVAAEELMPCKALDTMAMPKGGELEKDGEGGKG